MQNEITYAPSTNSVVLSRSVKKLAPHGRFILESPIVTKELIDDIKRFIRKSTLGSITSSEHNYLNKLISAYILIEKFKPNRNNKIENILYNYYLFLINDDKPNTPKVKTENFLFRRQLESYFIFLKITPPPDISFHLSPFEEIQTLAKYWNFTVKRNKSSILKFLAFFLNEFYDIPVNFIIPIFHYIQNPWKAVPMPLSVVPQKNYELNQIFKYFFGETKGPAFEIYPIPQADRLFSLTHPQFKNYLFLPEKNSFDIFDASLVVHEFQHIQDSHVAHEQSLFESEKKALYTEKVFLYFAFSSKKGKHCWIESNLLYPLALLEWELNIILSDTFNKNTFDKICQKHGLKPIMLSSLFEFNTPFQMSVYCAASMHIDRNWKNYFQINPSVELEK